MNLHLLKLFPDQVARYWHELSPMIEQALPPTTSTKTESRMTNILKALLSGRMDMLQYYDQNEEGVARIMGFAVISVVDNIDYSSQDMLIYAVYAYEPLSREIVANALELLIQYAKGIKCEAITAYTTLPRLIEHIRSRGGSANYTFLRLEV